MGSGFISGLKSYSDGQWIEFDEALNVNFHDPRAVKFTDMGFSMVREAVHRNGPICSGMTRWRHSLPARPA
jgi:hypothetical protein